MSARSVGGGAKRADMESAPTAVRDGLRPCGGVYGGAGVARRCKHRPLHGFAMPQDCGFPVGRGPRPVCRERSRPFRRALRRGNRADRESAPTAVREGLRPKAAFSAGRGPRRDEGIPPYGCFVGFAPTGNAPASDAGNPCRGGFHIRPGCWRRRKAGRYGIGPYSGAGGGCGQGRRFWRGGGAANAALLYPAQRNIRPQAEAAGVYFTGYWARCQVFCRPAVRAI